MRVVVTEKPSVARDLARVLGASTKREGFFEGEGLRITWCIGHLVELEDPQHYDAAWRKWAFDTLPMVPEKFALRLREGKGVKEQFQTVKKLVTDRSIEAVINACDAGREGELIFRYVMELAGLRKPVLRLWTSSLTDEAIKTAWRTLTPAASYDRLGDAARCRSEADWLVGLNGTRALTCLARQGGGGQLLSIGRVQTPTLAMIVARDRAITAFVPETYWVVRGVFEAAAGRWKATFFQGPTEKEKDEDDDEAPKAERIPDAATAAALVKAVQGRPGEVVLAERKRIREPPPLLYDLTSLQRRANERYGLSAPKTLEIAQALYEKHKLITYPRTDARHLTPDQVPELPKIVQGLQRLAPYAPFCAALLAAPIRPGKRVVDAAEVGDHHAILPTGRTPQPERLTADEKRVFDLVARRLLAALSPDAQFDATTLIVAVHAPREALPTAIAAPPRFRARGRVLREAGWRAIDPPGQRKDLDLPPVEQGDPATCVEAESNEQKTRPPRRYTDATLLHAMETAGRTLDDAALARAMRQAGLGTPATRAEILETLVRRGFIVRDQREILATERGVALIDALPVHELKSAELTGRWEARLAAIADGKDAGGRPAFMVDVVGHVRGIVDAIRQAPPPAAEAVGVEADSGGKPLGACPACGTPVRERKAAYTCDTGRSCPFFVPRVLAKRAISAKMVRQLLTDGRTDVVKGFKSKAGKDFEAGLAWKEGKVAFVFADRPERPPRAEEPPPPPATPVGRLCPRCGQGSLVRGRAAWGCDRWRDGCAFVLPFVVEGRALDDQAAAGLLAEGRLAGEPVLVLRDGVVTTA